MSVSVQNALLAKDDSTTRRFPADWPNQFFDLIEPLLIEGDGIPNVIEDQGYRKEKRAIPELVRAPAQDDENQVSVMVKY